MQLNSNEIAKILPHRFPFALVDRITDYEPGEWAKGIKCVSVNEQFFCGHFPQEHVMPGVLILEAMAQVGGVALLSLPENRGKIALFGGGEARPLQAESHPRRCAGDGVRAQTAAGAGWHRYLPGRCEWGGGLHSRVELCCGG